jgi:general secretion pathway protein L
MAETVLAKYYPSTQQCAWTDWANARTVQHGSLQDLADAVPDAKPILLLPATDVLLFTVDLPVSQRQIARALPYAIEDGLADDVETYHLAWQKLPDGQVAVAAIGHDVMAGLLQMCQDAGLNLSAVYAEALFLPYQSDEVSVLLDGDYAAVRYGECQGGGCEQDFLPLFLEKIQMGQDSSAVRIFSQHPVTRINPAETELIDDPLLWLAANLPPKPLLNLLTGHYQPRHARSFRWHHGLPTAAFLLLTVLWQYGTVLNRYWDTEKQLQNLEADNKALFQQTFPNLKRIVNIKTQAEQELIALRKHNAGGSGFLRLLYPSGEWLAQHPEVQLQAVEFSNAVLGLKLTASDSAPIEAFKQSLHDAHGLVVQIVSADPDNNGITARIDIREDKP